MPFAFEKTNIDGVIVVRPHLFVDHRGIYRKTYEKEIFAVNGITCNFTESSDLYSHKGTIRGLHYQTVDPQAKLIHVIAGVLFDVAVDLRPESSTFGQFHAEILKAEENKAMYIPERFAHGFMALTEHTIFSYQCSGKYRPEFCSGIRWDDPDLNISWPVEEYGIKDIVATRKDMEWPGFSESVQSIKWE